MEETLLEKLAGLSSDLYAEKEKLQKAVGTAQALEDFEKCAVYYKDEVLSAMESVRTVVDSIEVLMAKEFLPYPTYGELLYYI